MVVVRTVERQIRNVERFDVRIHFFGAGRSRGRDVRSDREDLPSYPFARRRADNDTVAAWRTDRFESTYPGFTAVVLDGEGREVDGRMRLATVRSTYS